MSKEKRVAVAVLAAGSSKRFGTADKLSADFRGKMLGLHVAQAIPRKQFANAWVITARKDHPCADEWTELGYEIRQNMRASEGLGSSVALAASLATYARADALMVALADMPLIKSSHFASLAEAIYEGGHGTIAVSAAGDKRLPPAIFGHSHFARLSALDGEFGARDILEQGQVVDCPADWLADIDTPEALSALG